jgi:hypothetical protein
LDLPPKKVTQNAVLPVRKCRDYTWTKDLHIPNNQPYASKYAPLGDSKPVTDENVRVSTFKVMTKLFGHTGEEN